MTPSTPSQDSDNASLVASTGPAVEFATGEAALGSPVSVPSGPQLAAHSSQAARVTSAADSTVNPAADLHYAGPDEEYNPKRLRRRVLILALPVLGEQIMNTFVAWNDTYLAGHLGVSATAAVGFSAYVSWLIAMIFGLVGTGATAIVARAVGAGDKTETKRATNQAIVLSLMLGMLATTLIPLAAPHLAGWTSPSAQTLGEATRFMTIDSRAYLIESFTFIAAACLRGAGDTRTPMLVLGVVNVVNMLMSWFCAFRIERLPDWLVRLGVDHIGLGMGCDGIAWGTVIARFVGGAVMLAVMLRGCAGLSIVGSMLRPAWDMIGRILKIGGPAAIDGGLMWMGHLVFLKFIARSGEGVGMSSDTMVAAHIVGVRIESLSYLPAMAWSTAAATLVGQNLGARRPDRSRRSANEAAKQATVVIGFMAVLYLLFAPQFFQFLTDDVATVATGVPALRIQALIQPALACLIVYMGALRGAGDTVYPMFITTIGMVCLRIPLSYLGGVVLKGGLVGAWVGMNLDLLTRSILMTWRFRTGKWALKRV